MSQNIKSYTYLAGRFNAMEGLSYKSLEEKENWSRISLSKKQFDLLKRTYYPAHLQAMGEVAGTQTDVFRYQMELQTDDKDSSGLMVLKGEDYPCSIEEVCLWFFPCKMVLFSIKVDDSGMDLDKLILMHGKWKNWSNKYQEVIVDERGQKDIGFHTAQLDKILKPLAELTKDGSPSKITHENTKIRQYQVVQGDCIDDELLYEIGTFSSIGVVKDENACKPFKPSDDYYRTIISENRVSAFSNWKALALNDSFTVLAYDKEYIKEQYPENPDPIDFASSEFDEYNILGEIADTGYHYFDLLYMRCLLEEYYCFDRNNSYRDNTPNNPKQQLEEIKYMEQRYFYDDLSYDFLPTIMIRAMEKGLGLEGDRTELTQRIKQAMKEEQRQIEEIQQKSNNLTVNIIKVFAVVTIVWTLYQMALKIWPCIDKPCTAGIFSVIAILAAIAFVWIILKGSRK